MFARNGFSIVELSVVLVIIGIIIGASVSTVNILKSAKLQTVISEIESLEESFSNFKNKFTYFPGDLPNASAYWSSSDGDGNWQIDGTNGGPNNNEGLRAWQHLSLAKMVKENYTGVGSPANRCVLVQNCPKSILKGLGYSLSFDDINDAIAAPINANTLIYGRVSPTSLTNVGGLKTQQINNIDDKIDDGLPGTGRVLGGHNNCFTGSAYNTSDEITLCTLQLVLENQFTSNR